MPDWKGYVRKQLGPLELTAEREIEIIEELAQHLEAAYEDGLAEGLSEREAFARATAQVADWRVLECEIGRLRERTVETWAREGGRQPGLIDRFQGKGARLMQALLQDLRYGIRMLVRNPGVTLVAVSALALGIGANTAIFSVVNALLLRPLPYHQPERLVKVLQANVSPLENSVPVYWSYPRFEVLRDESRGFSAVSGYAARRLNLTGTEMAEQLRAEMVSASYFEMLGVTPIAGRAFMPEDDRTPVGGQVAILSYGLWQRRFGGESAITGRNIELDGKPFTIVGVAPQEFKGQDGSTDIWLPITASPVLFYKRILTNPNNYWFQVIARLGSGVSIEQAQAEMLLVSDRIEQAHPGPTESRPSGAGSETVTLIPLRDVKVDPAIKRAFLILLAAVSFVLLIACGNTANLLVARAVARRREIALRLAMGASRGRIVRQLLTESLLMALISGLIGIFVARWGIEFLTAFKPSDNAQFWSSYARTFDFFTIDPDWRVLLFTLGLTFLTGLLFGLIPAIQSSRPDINEALKEGSGSSASGFVRQRRLGVRNLLAAGQIALSLVLLVCAGLMVKSLLQLGRIETGFSPENVLTMALPSRTADQDFYRKLLDRVSVLPGVESAAISGTAPLLGQNSMTVFEIEGRPQGKNQGTGFHSVSPDYFKTLGIGVLEGRVFDDRDREGARRVAVINRTFADRFFPGENPLGRRLKPAIDPAWETDQEMVEIIGVVDDAKYGRLEEAADPDLYLAFLQPTDSTETLTVKSAVDPESLTASIRREVLALDRNVPLVRVQTMKDRLEELTSRTRFIALLLGLFAGLALLLAAIGVYGVMAFWVSSRTREVGIRIALGARRYNVLRLILIDGLAPVAVGLAAGLAISWMATRILENQLYEVNPLDPLTFIGVAALLLVVALIACYIPARRATRIDPVVALRCE